MGGKVFKDVRDSKIDRKLFCLSRFGSPDLAMFDTDLQHHGESAGKMITSPSVVPLARVTLQFAGWKRPGVDGGCSTLTLVAYK